jgi:hypothetical protein
LDTRELVMLQGYRVPGAHNPSAKCMSVLRHVLDGSPDGGRSGSRDARDAPAAGAHCQERALRLPPPRDPQAPAQGPPPPLPEGWQAAVDCSSGFMYFFEIESRRVTWSRPTHIPRTPAPA